MSEVEQTQPHLSGSSCWDECLLWIHDGLDSWSHCRRICIYSAWVSGYVLRSIKAQHTSIANAPPWFWKNQSYHPSILSNRLGSLCLGNSASTSGRLQRHCTTQRAFTHTQKILGYPPQRQYIALMLSPWQSAKNHQISGPYKKNIQHPWGSQWLPVCMAVDENPFGPCFQFTEVYAKAQTSILLSHQHDSITPWALARADGVCI